MHPFKPHHKTTVDRFTTAAALAWQDDSLVHTPEGIESLSKLTDQQMCAAAIIMAQAIRHLEKRRKGGTWPATTISRDRSTTEEVDQC